VRPITWPETDVLRMLLEHLFKEKIQRATNSRGKNKAPAVHQNSTDETGDVLGDYNGGEPDDQDDARVPSEKSKVESSQQNEQASALAQQFKGFCFRLSPARVPPGATIVEGDLFGIEQNSASPLLIIDQGNGELLEIPSKRVLYATQNGESVSLVVGVEPRVAPSPAPNPPGTEMAGSTFLPDGIAARANTVKKVTGKAICVENRAGSILWIPRSAFSDDQAFPEGPLQNPWDFSLKGWFARKSDAQTWLAGH